MDRNGNATPPIPLAPGATPRHRLSASGKAEIAVAHVLDRIASEPALAYFFDPITESMQLLTAAHAETLEQDVKVLREEIRQRFRAERPVCRGRCAREEEDE